MHYHINSGCPVKAVRTEIVSMEEYDSKIEERERNQNIFIAVDVWGMRFLYEHSREGYIKYEVNIS